MPASMATARLSRWDNAFTGQHRPTLRSFMLAFGSSHSTSSAYQIWSTRGSIQYFFLKGCWWGRFLAHRGRALSRLFSQHSHPLEVGSTQSTRSQPRWIFKPKPPPQTTPLRPEGQLPWNCDKDLGPSRANHAMDKPNSPGG